MKGRSRVGKGPFRWGLLGAALVLPAACGASEPPQPVPPAGEAAGQVPERGGPGQGTVRFGSAYVIFGSDTVRAEVARTPEQRERGLMYRTDVPAGTGMLFIFPEEQEITFWMSNTYVSLDVAFFDSSLTVVDIQQMDARTTDYHDSRVPSMYALEVPRGWLAAHGVRLGSRARLVVLSD